MRAGRAGAVAVAVCTLAGCGNALVSSTVTSSTSTAVPGTGSPSASPTATPPPPELLIAVTESHDPNALDGVFDTVAIVGVDGVARAKATVTPRTPPEIGNAAPILQPGAHVAAGLLFYIDGAGVVRSLAPLRGARPSTVATFAPPRPQGYTAFAVSPDGAHLLASVYTLSAFVPPSPGDDSNPFGSGGDPVSDALETADAGGPTQTVKTYPKPDKPVTAAGWDATGPLVLVDPPLGTQSERAQGWYSPVARLQGGGVGQALGPAGCVAVEESGDGLVLCTHSQETDAAVLADVCEQGGAVRWSAKVAAPSGRSDILFSEGIHLAPDGEHVTYVTNTNAGQHAFAVGRDGRAVGLGDLSVQGWVDATTVIGRVHGDGDLAMVSLTDPARLQDMGFKGDFVGVVTHP